MNRKSNYKNIEKWREACNRQRRRNYSQTAYSKNHCKRWSDKEIEIVMLHEVPDRMISEIIGRSVESIQYKRCMEKKKEVNNGRER